MVDDMSDSFKNITGMTKAEYVKQQTKTDIDLDIFLSEAVHYEIDYNNQCTRYYFDDGSVYVDIPK